MRPFKVLTKDLLGLGRGDILVMSDRTELFFLGVVHDDEISATEDYRMEDGSVEVSIVDGIVFGQYPSVRVVDVKSVGSRVWALDMMKRGMKVTAKKIPGREMYWKMRGDNVYICYDGEVAVPPWMDGKNWMEHRIKDGWEIFEPGYYSMGLSDLRNHVRELIKENTILKGKVKALEKHSETMYEVMMGYPHRETE